MTDEDLHQRGLMVVGNEVVPVTSPPDVEADNESWLGYAVAQLGYSKEFETQAQILGRKSAVHLYRAGHGFSVVRERHKEEGTWMALLEGKGLAHSTVLQAIQLYERAGSEDAVKELGVTEAKTKFGIVKPQGSRAVSRPSSRHASRSRPASRRRPSTNGNGASSSDTPATIRFPGLLDATGQPITSTPPPAAPEPEQREEGTEEDKAGTVPDIDSLDPYTVLHQIGMVLDRLAERMKREPPTDAQAYLDGINEVAVRLEVLRHATQAAE
jgi:hypothetical protein